MARAATASQGRPDQSPSKRKKPVKKTVTPKHQPPAAQPDPTNEAARYGKHHTFAVTMRDLRAPDGADGRGSGHFIAKTPQCGYIEVTPQLAKLLLGWVAINRAIDERNMTLLISQMESGAWLVTGDAVQIDRNGNVFEGQHRLLSIFLTGKSQTLLIAWGLDPKAAHVAGDGKPKTLADALLMQDVPDARRRAAWITSMEAVLGRKHGRISRTLGLLYNAQFDAELGWMSAAAPKSRPWCRAPVLAAFIIAYRRAPEAVEALSRKVLHNVGKPGLNTTAGQIRAYLTSLGPEEPVRGYTVTCTVLNGILAHLTRAQVQPLGGTPEGLTYFTRYAAFEGN